MTYIFTTMVWTGKAKHSPRPPICLRISQMSELPMESEVMEQYEMQPANNRNGLSDGVM